MTDRELLERAAKAAGMETRWDQPRGAKTGVLRARVPGSGDSFPYWNPLEDDADAFQLAVKLRLDVHFEMNGIGCETPIVEVMRFSDFIDGSAFCGSEDCTSDPYAATRRAIVRAAAEMAK